jgi:hypothetical protein
MIPQTETLKTLMDLDPALHLRPGRGFVVIHPLHDQPETKCSADHLGPLKLTPGCRTALIAVRFYLVAIMLMGGYRVVALVHALRR